MTGCVGIEGCAIGVKDNMETETNVQYLGVIASKKRTLQSVCICDVQAACYDETPPGGVEYHQVTLYLQPDRLAWRGVCPHCGREHWAEKG